MHLLEARWRVITNPPKVEDDRNKYSKKQNKTENIKLINTIKSLFFNRTNKTKNL